MNREGYKSTEKSGSEGQGNPKEEGIKKHIEADRPRHTDTHTHAHPEKAYRDNGST